MLQKMFVYDNIFMRKHSTESDFYSAYYKPLEKYGRKIYHATKKYLVDNLWKYFYEKKLSGIGFYPAHYKPLEKYGLISLKWYFIAKICHAIKNVW